MLRIEELAVSDPIYRWAVSQDNADLIKETGGVLDEEGRLMTYWGQDMVAYEDGAVSWFLDLRYADNPFGDEPGRVYRIV